MLARVLIILALVVVLGVPLVARLATTEPAPPATARRLIIATPHVPQIRAEFGEAFERWHQRIHGEPVSVDWRAPGAGTSEILKLLEAQYAAAAKAGKFDFTDPKNPVCPPGTIPFDLLFGGGTFDHGRLKSGIKTKVIDGGAERDVSIPMSVPAGLEQAMLDRVIGENRIGAGLLYDKDQYWIGAALSGFGIVYNRDMFRELGLPEPARFADLTDPRLANSIILADPRQSGSVMTAIEAILNASLWNTARAGGWEEELNRAFDEEAKSKTPWERSLSAERMASVEDAFDRAWRLLREMTANSRTYTAAATRPPIDISAGEGAAGLAIDFYGRGQAQAVLAPGQDPATGRVGYVDPKGEAYIDADPASILRGGPEPELAKRFIEFCLTDEAQLLWQLPSARSPAGEDNPVSVETKEQLGPRRYELRRMPVRRDFYPVRLADGSLAAEQPANAKTYFPHFIDQVNPFEIASGNRSCGWRSAIGPMLGSFAIDNAPAQRRAWAALRRAREDSAFPNDSLDQMERAFFSMPETPVKGADGPVRNLPFTAANFRAIRDAWRDARAMAAIEIGYAEFFRERYDEVVRLGERVRPAAAAAAR